MSTWVFLRGLTRESRHWGDFPAIFCSEITDANIVALDLPGNGDLNCMRSPTSVEAMAEYCRQEIAGRNFKPPYRVLAMSLGAMVALSWATSHPEDVCDCVLINTSLRPLSPFYSRLRPQNYLSLLKLALPCYSDDAREATILRMTSNLAGNRAQIVETWSAWRRHHPVSRVNALRQLWAANRYDAPLQRPAPRLLVLASEKDTLVDPCCSQHLARHWQADFAMHPLAGHDISLDDGTWVARQVRDWLQHA